MSGKRPLDIAQFFPERYEATVAQIENIAATYEKFGVKVHRPRPYSDDEKRYLGVLQE